MILFAIPLLPLAAAALSLPAGHRRVPAVVTLLANCASLALAIRAAGLILNHRRIVGIPGWVEMDGFGVLVVLLVTFVATTAALFSWGYVSAREHDAGRIRSYFAHFNLFVFALAVVPILAEPALVWIGIEFTAVFSVLLVAFDGTREALEAAWKYIALMFMGAAVALLGFLILFWAQQIVGGGHYTWDGLRAVAPRLSPVLVRSAFLLILVGFGTKAGFVPLHTWLPDAHSQAPSPVCSLLSGVKTTVALYCILRLVPLLPTAWSGVWMRTIGLLSTGVAAFLLLQVRDYKRLFAYSTVEHMGVILVAAGLGTNDGSYGAVLQIISHGVTKSFCFFAAGAVLLLLGTREIGAVRDLVRVSPATGAALLFGALAIGGAPPMAVFLSELSIFRAGLASGHYVTTALLVAFIAVAFFGILLHVHRMVFGSRGVDEEPGHPVPVSLPASCVLTLLIAAVPVCVLGVYQPESFHQLVTLAASSLTGAPLP